MNKKTGGFIGIGVLIVVIVSLVSGVGYYAYSLRSNTDNAATQNQNLDQAEKKPALAVKSGYRVYEDGNLAFEYPDSWTTEKSDSQPEWVSFTSPDYRMQEVGPSLVVQAGHLLEVRVSSTGKNEAFEQSLKQIRAGQGGAGERIVQIDSRDAVLSEVADGQSTFITAATFANGKTYSFRLNGSNRDKTSQLLDSLIATVRLR